MIVDDDEDGQAYAYCDECDEAMTPAEVEFYGDVCHECRASTCDDYWNHVWKPAN
jgi:hypothetical protein